MLIRLLQIGIVLFWLTTVALLVRDIQRESNNHLAKANVDFVLDTLYSWNDSTRLNLLENGADVGRLDVSASKDPLDPENGPRFVSLNTHIFKNADRPNSISARANFSLDRDRKIVTTEVAIDEKTTGGFSVYFRLDDAKKARLEASPALDLEVKKGEMSLLEFHGEASSFAQSFSGDGGLLPGMAFLPAIPFELGGEKQGDLTSRINVFEDLTAWQGTKDFDGLSISIFMLKKEIGPKQSIRLYLTEAGEPLKVETDIGFEAISDILVVSP